MSLAMYAAPFDDNKNETLNPNDTNNDSVISKKRNNNNKTQKQYQSSSNTEKVNSMLDIMHNSSNDSTNDLGDFKPMPPPSSVGVENTRIKEGMASLTETTAYDTNVNNNETYMETPDDLRELNQNYMNKQAVKEYYQRYAPQYKRPMPEETPTNNVLIDKLNYMIHLLEEQQDDKIGSATEDVVLYSFLGIFIIFIVDSFARVGKYVR